MSETGAGNGTVSLAASVSGHDVDWAVLTRRLVELVRRDPAAGSACMDLSEEFEADGVPALAALRQALDRYDDLP
jgi:hypothetical protein